MHWKAAGFDVPDIVEMNVPGLDEPYIVTGYVEGPSLHEYLSQDGPSTEEKLKVVARVFEELSRRHGQAIGERDRKLIHHDPSSGNIICCGEKLSFVDFESPPKSRCTVSESASIELATLCRWIVRDLGPKFLEQTLKLMVTAYKEREPLLNLVIKRTTARPFQFYHRWKNQRFKKLYPNEVTKYDVADGLMHIIS
jgi:tRNA A-37 threonylcarbamoyl transferase component Bud32